MKKSLTILGVLQLVVAIGAIPAGISFVIVPDGSGIGMPVSILKGAPFDDFLIPGILLVFILGLPNLIGAYFSFRKKENADLLGIVVGIVLIIWIVVQVYLIGMIHFLQPLFLIIGMVITVLGYRCKQRY